MRALDHRVVIALHKPCLSSGPVKTVFKTPLNGKDHSVLVNFKKRIRKEEIFLFQN